MDMIKRTWIMIAVIVLGGLLLVEVAAGMSSTNYRLDWYTPLTSSGGPASSTNYAGNFSVGQAVIGYASSTGYTVGLGYWYGAAGGYKVYLPLIWK
jgi:hypothetical protein